MKHVKLGIFILALFITQKSLSSEFEGLSGCTIALKTIAQGDEGGQQRREQILTYLTTEHPIFLSEDFLESVKNAAKIKSISKFFKLSQNEKEKVIDEALQRQANRTLAFENYKFRFISHTDNGPTLLTGEISHPQSLALFLRSHDSDLISVAIRVLGDNQKFYQDYERFLQIQKIDVDNITSFWPHIKRVGGIVSGGIGGTLVTLAAFHSFVPIELGFAVPTFLAGMAYYKDIVLTKRLTTEKSPIPTLETTSTAGLDFKPRQTRTYDTELIRIDPEVLKKLQPAINLDSLQSILEFGNDLEQGVHILSRESGYFQEQLSSDENTKTIIKALEEITKSGFKRAPPQYMTVEKGLGKPLRAFQSYIQKYILAADELAQSHKILADLFSSHLFYLQKTIREHPDKKEDLLPREFELKEFEKTENQIGQTIQSQKQQVIIIRDLATKAMNVLSANLHGSQKTISSNDLNILSKFKEYLSSL